MNRLAIIDLGTNTFNLLIVEIKKNKTFDFIFQTKQSVKLGEGGINGGVIESIQFECGLKTLSEYKLICENLGVEKIVAVATSAIRTAKNGLHFVSEAEEKYGIRIEIISGDREAKLIYLGVKQAVKMTNEYSLIMDIGGGSTEFIIASKDKVMWKKSFLLGVARLLEKFNPSDPIKDVELKDILVFLNKELTPLFNAIEEFPVQELIGSSGSFDSLAEMIAYDYSTPEMLNSKTEYIFDLRDCRKIFEMVIKSKRAERHKMKGLIEMRVDMFVISSIFVQYILSTFEIKKMRLSTYSLKEGALYELLNMK